jgi:hypothetical protein
LTSEEVGIMGFSTRTLLGWTMFVGIVTLALSFPAAEASPYNSVTLTWTAPGDDGSTGTASYYDIRYSTSNINGADTTAWWNEATQCTGEPDPQEAGASESFVVTDLEHSTTYYFMIRTADEASNWSGYSNVAEVATEVPEDTIPPAAVRDLAFFLQNGDFSLVLSESCASVAHETQRRPVNLWTSPTARGAGLLCFMHRNRLRMMADV